MPLSKPPMGSLLRRGHPLANGLVCSLLFNQGSGDKVYDSSGHGSIGTFANADPATDWPPGPFGPAVNFGGSNDSIAIANGRVTQALPTVSLYARFRRTRSNAIEFIINKFANPNYDFSMVLWNSANGVSFSTATNFYYSGIAPASGTWSAAVIVAGPSYLRFYVNGAEVIAASPPASLTAGTKNVVLGVQVGTTLPFAGQLSEVGIWDRLLDRDTALALSNPDGNLFYDMYRTRPVWWYVPAGGGEAQTATASRATATAAAYGAAPAPGNVTGLLALASAVAAAYGVAATPGAVSVTASFAMAAGAAYGAAVTPGDVSVAASLANAAGAAYGADAAAGTGVISAGIATAGAAAYTTTATPGAATTTVSLAQAIAQALAATGTPGTVTVLPGIAAATAYAYAATASHPGAAQTAYASLANAVATAYAATGSVYSAGLRDTLVIIDTRDILLIGDVRDILRLY